MEVSPQQNLNKVAAKLNSRQRKILGFQTPVAKRESVLQSPVKPKAAERLD
jgi:IS30 family transposase